VDELTMLRAMAAEEPPASADARTEVWNRLQRPRRLRFRPNPRTHAAIGAMAICAAAVMALLVVNRGPVGVQTAEAACGRPQVVTQQCLSALAEVAGTRTTTSGPIVYQRWISFQRPLRIIPPGTAGPGIHRTGVTRPFDVQEVDITETWVNRSNWHGVRRESSRIAFPSAADRSAWRASGSPTWQRMS